jgi:hypothetical protein
MTDQTSQPEEFTDEQYAEILGFWQQDIHAFEAAEEQARAAMVANLNEQTMAQYSRARTLLVQGQEQITRLTEYFESKANPEGLTNAELESARNFNLTPEQYAKSKRRG